MITTIKRMWKKWRQNQLFNSIPDSDKKLINDILDKKLTYLPKHKFVGLLKCCQEIERKNTEGIFVEAGCALGGSAIFLSKQKDRNRAFLIYDVFEMIPSPSEKDPKEVHERYQEIVSGKSRGIGGDPYYGYKRNLYDEVISNLHQFGINPEKENIQLVKGLLQETMKINESIALAHVDVDWYDPVQTALERLFPNLSPGGFIILDDYFDWGGCRQATDEFLKTVKGEFSLDSQYGSLIIQKN